MSGFSSSNESFAVLMVLFVDCRFFLILVTVLVTLLFPVILGSIWVLDRYILHILRIHIGLLKTWYANNIQKWES